MTKRAMAAGGWVSLILFGWAAGTEAAPAVPAPLDPWREWVLHGVADAGCPSPYDDASTRLAVWPSAFNLELTPDGGSWQMEVRAFAETWLPLPGDADTWPE